MEKDFTAGFARRLTADELKSNPPKYYLPHFGVPKDKRDESKGIRVVYDGTVPFKDNAINKAVCPGPTIINSLPETITEFRPGQFAWSADIQAMYSQVGLPPEDQMYHGFLWTERDGTTSTCIRTRVTFGLACSPYVAISATHQAAKEAGPGEEEAAEDITKMYVDDLLRSAKTEANATHRAVTAKKLLKAGGFPLVGFASNSPKLLEAVGEQSSTQDVLLGNSDHTEPLLGMTWRPATDMLGFRVHHPGVIDFTRVGVLSRVAELYDPLGLAACLVVKAKIQCRALGTKGLGWTDPLDEDNRNWWIQYFHHVQQLRNIEMPRCLFPDEDNIVRRELHTFCDASEDAIAAVVFLRVVYRDGRVSIPFIKAATKLMPAAVISVVKGELNASLLGARLCDAVMPAIGRPIHQRFFWTDSAPVRNLVRATAAFYKTYFSVRIGEIQSLTKPPEWRFIPGKINPADIATRAKLEDEAIPHAWLLGPPFLLEPIDCWPEDLPWMKVTEELRTVRAHHAEVQVTFDWNAVTLADSTIQQLVQLSTATMELVRRCQEEAFADDLVRLRAGKRLLLSSRLQPFTPFLDDHGILRMGGRLRKAALPYDNRHPVLMPGRHPLSRKIVELFHHQLHHAGTDYVLTHVRQHFWIMAGRELVKCIRRDCLRCRRHHARPLTQLMADLHESRLAAGAPPFSYTAVDYFGPFETTYGRGRTQKRWGVLFTCLSTRATYLDLAASLSADDFLLVLRRFIGIYTKPTQMRSDNGTNFVGAERQLLEAVEALHESEVTRQFMLEQGIDWAWQPARSPHFGGAHEALVKSTKRALYAALEVEKQRHRHPTDDILRTLLFEVAGLLNARPLTPASNDPTDLRPLTPNDFLNRPPTADRPAGDFADALPQQRFRYLQRMLDLFWTCWRRDYLQSLTARMKWQTKDRNLAVGDLVLEVDKAAKRSQWKTGRITAVFPGADGLVRAVDVLFDTGTFRRGITELCLLDPGSPSSPPEQGSGEHVTEKPSD